MKRKLAKVFALMLAVALLTTCFPAMAANDQTSSTVPLMVSTSDPVFSVSVPTTLPIHMDAAGNITCGEITITNNSSGPVLVEDTQIAALNGWTLADYATTTFTDTDKGQHKIALQLSAVDDAISANGGAKAIEVSAKIPCQGGQINNASIAQVVFVLGWHKSKILEGLTIIGDDSVDVGSTIQLSAEKIPADTADTGIISWSSSNTAVATVSNSGVVMGKSTGIAVITASCNGVNSTKNVKVYDPATSAKFVDSNGRDIDIDGMEFRVWGGAHLSVHILPESAAEGRSITIISSNENVLRIEGSTIYVTGQIGTGTITVICGSFSKTYGFEVGHWS